MTREQIVEEIAKGRTVERLCMSVTHSPTMTQNLSDLVQSIYLVLLEYDREKVEDMWESGSLGFFIVNVIKRQWFSKNSPYYKTYRRFSAASVPIDTRIHEDEQ